MVLGYVQMAVAKKVSVVKPKDVTLDFSFADDMRVSEEDFYEILEDLEEEMQVNLLDFAWRFETVKNLVEHINRFS